ncbi:hypothetical protein Clacol_006979 [Clathrus columnatus]|uniref:Aminoglycoside phosphotransferase domain-containing protein n=1 Tax=Clathrus columnatus TaxID=1419009 RepID=A0AAV5AES3_9AGAM|nr:hypothetical protein Clacol_006979 [Clathrus columnatus]
MEAEETLQNEYIINRRVSPNVQLFPFGVYAKLSDSQEEPLATEFVRLNTTIPVPKVLDVIPSYLYGTQFDSVILLTKRIPGVPFSDSTKFEIETATPEQREIFQRTLYTWLTQLRNIPTPHSEKVCGFSGGSLTSFRIETAHRQRVGPWSDVREFHAQNFNTAFPNYPDEADEQTKRAILERPSKEYRICLTHGDLQPHNLLIDDNGRPCGLIDWETASWMPEYWEHIIAIRMFVHGYPAWANIWREIFPQYEDDLRIEGQIDKWFFP